MSLPDDVTQKVKEIIANINVQSTALANMRQSVASRKERVNELQHELMEVIKILEDKLAHTKAGSSDCEQTIAKLQGEIATKDKALAKAMEEIAGLEKHIETLEKANAQIENEKQVLRDEIQELRRQMAEVEKKMESLEDKLASEYSKSSSDNEKIANLETIMNDLQDELRSLKEDHKSCLEQRDKLTDASRDLEAKIAQMEEKMARQAERAQQLEGQIERAESEMVSARNEREKLQAELEKAAAELDDCQNSKRKLQEENQMLRTQLESIEAEKLGLEQAMSQLEQAVRDELNSIWNEKTKEGGLDDNVKKLTNEAGQLDAMITDMIQEAKTVKQRLMEGIVPPALEMEPPQKRPSMAVVSPVASPVASPPVASPAKFTDDQIYEWMRTSIGGNPNWALNPPAIAYMLEHPDETDLVPRAIAQMPRERWGPLALQIERVAESRAKSVMAAGRGAGVVGWNAEGVLGQKVRPNDRSIFAAQTKLYYVPGGKVGENAYSREELGDEYGQQIKLRGGGCGGGGCLPPSMFHIPW